MLLQHLKTLKAHSLFLMQFSLSNLTLCLLLLVTLNARFKISQEGLALMLTYEGAQHKSRVELIKLLL